MEESGEISNGPPGPQAKTGYLPHIARGAAINFSGIFGRALIVYVYTFILARLMAPEQLGEFFLMFTVINLVALAAVAGLDFGILRYVALYAGVGELGSAKKVVKGAVLLGLATSVTLMIILWLSAPAINRILFDDSNVAVNGIRIFAIAIPLMVCARLFNATTQGMHQMRFQVYANDIGEQVSKLLLAGTALILGAGLIGVVLANVTAVAIGLMMAATFALWVLFRRPETAESSEKPVANLVKYSVPLAATTVLMALIMWIDTLLLGYFSTSTNVGYYAVAAKVALVSARILTAFAAVFSPVISDLWNRRQGEELNILFKTVSRWIFTMTYPIFLVLAVFADPVLSIFGADFVVASTAMIMIAFGQLVTASTGTASMMLLMSGRSRLELVNVLIILVFDVIMCILLIPRFGLAGAAFANMASFSLVNMIRVVEVWFLMRLHAFDRFYFKPLLSGAMGAAVVFVAGRFLLADGQPVRIAALAAVMVILYVGSMALMGFNERDKKILNMVKTRLARAEA
ncbi:MAG: flippase [Thermoleophilia bacterium]|nr:flippase [Thermoleophilia bacterium]